MKNKRQIVTLAVLILGWQFTICCTPCPTILMDYVGTLDSENAGARAAVLRLSKAVHRCAEARRYSVGWRIPPAEHEIGWRALVYDRRDKTSGVIGYEYDPDSGTQGETYLIDDTAIDQVAKEGGVLKDFARYSKGKPE